MSSLVGRMVDVTARGLSTALPILRECDGAWGGMFCFWFSVPPDGFESILLFLLSAGGDSLRSPRTASKAFFCF